MTPATEDRTSREAHYWDDVYTPGTARHVAWADDERGREDSYVERRFAQLLEGPRGRRVLSLGGGVDRLAVELARRGDRVVTIDLSRVAAARTLELARRAGVAERCACLVGSAERIAVAGGTFDVVFCQRALHHMELSPTLDAIADALAPEGRFIAEEPVCLSRILRRIHAYLPYYPTLEITDDERELTAEDLEQIVRRFRSVRLEYHEVTTRSSVAYWMRRLHAGRWVSPLSRLDAWLVNRACPWLRGLACWVTVDARR